MPVSTPQGLQGAFGSSPWASLAPNHGYVLSTPTRCPGQWPSLAVFCSYLVIVTIPGALSAALLSLNPPDPDALAKKMTLAEGR